MSVQGPHALLVAGVVTSDLLLSPMTCTHADTQPSASGSGEDLQLTIRNGAAHLVAQLLTAAQPQWGFEVVGPELKDAEFDHISTNATSMVELETSLSSPVAGSSLHVIRKRNLARPHTWHAPPIKQGTGAQASTVIISGSGNALHDAESALDFLRRSNPRHIIHHMTRPLATGRLWNIISTGSTNLKASSGLEYLIVIVDADDLRAEGIPLSRSLSWEKTAEDFVRNLGSNGKLSTLVSCPHLIVRFGNEGVIYRGRDSRKSKLFFQSRRIEKDDQGLHTSQMIELASAFTAGFAVGCFANTSDPSPNVERGIHLGLAAARAMESRGFIRLADGTPDYPIKATIDSLNDAEEVVTAVIPSDHISSSNGDTWNLLNEIIGDPADVARRIVTLGPDRALAKSSIQQYGDLLSVDRTEQQSIGAVVRTIQEGMTLSTGQPTSIGIFGPEGSGKKFVTRNIARHVAASIDAEILEYDAQLISPDNLVRRCHEIRDYAARGRLPIVIFHNFEAILSKNDKLTTDFLVIMRDGSFLDRGQVHYLGRSTLFFLANQDAPSHESAPTPIAKDFRDRSLSTRDEPGIMSTLQAVHRVAGPNQADIGDREFCIRRAIMLRHMLTQKFPSLAANGNIVVGDPVLRALLFVQSYKHGLRSIDKLLTSRIMSRREFQTTELPPEEQIRLHVDGPAFMNQLRTYKLPAALRERIGEPLHKAYKDQRRAMAETEKERADLGNDAAMLPWRDLPGELQESTRCQADDIPRKLRALNCFMTERDLDEPFQRLREFPAEHMDMLGRLEHERYNAERLNKQWKMGPRDSSNRSTPFLVDYDQLEPKWQNVDIAMVQCVPSILETLGWKIYRNPDPL